MLPLYLLCKLIYLNIKLISRFSSTWQDLLDLKSYFLYKINTCNYDNINM